MSARATATASTANTAETASATTFPLEHVHDIEIDAERMDLTVEGDAALSDELTLAGATGQDAPRLILEDTTLRLVQEGRHQPGGTGRLILRVPAKGCPAIT